VQQRVEMTRPQLDARVRVEIARAEAPGTALASMNIKAFETTDGRCRVPKPKTPFKSFKTPPGQKLLASVQLGQHENAKSAQGPVKSV
jgi:hypothetical protein